jgi:hypothetical protein
MDAEHRPSSYREVIAYGCEISDDEAEEIRARDQAAAIELHAALHRRRPIAYLVAVASATWLRISLWWARHHQPTITLSDQPTEEPTS